jgi:hypothetical protein
MTGPRERPSTQPREKRKASAREITESTPSTYRQERAAIIFLYAAKIAAARLYAPKHELAAIVAAIRAEEEAALRALKERREFEKQANQRKRLGWRFATRAVTDRMSSKKPGRPFAPGRRRGRDRQHG